MAFVWHVTDRDHGTVAAIFTGPDFPPFAGVVCLYSDYQCAAKYIQAIKRYRSVMSGSVWRGSTYDGAPLYVLKIGMKKNIMN